ncbi:hypothetical protein J1N35_015288 [Gossypium stocksii]|uniref:Reverse transcriptase domain-containing protein n=1 Tax=Gossypium stocksii TaxID=47602 RepID=A0A9D3VW07_9ROSI|nr:hypothetical protein J1N35_015288 [Gossypium stocksii]
MVSIEETKGEIWNCNESKASRPDGYDFNFFRHSWAIIKEDLLLFVRDFIFSSRIDKAVNSTFLLLISKRAGGCFNFRCIKIFDSRLCISHLYFADDIMLFFEAKEDQTLWIHPSCQKIFYKFDHEGLELLVRNQVDG